MASTARTSEHKHGIHTSSTHTHTQCFCWRVASTENHVVVQVQHKKRGREREKTSKNRQGVERNKMGKSIEQNVCVCVCHVNWRKPHATRKYFFERGRRRQHDVDKARDSDCAATAANRLAQAAAK